ncbi:hypothetical protein SMMN14_07956 [Sphaerulina musiva]
MMFPKVFYYYLFTGFAVFNLAVGDDICGFGGTKCQPCAINGETNNLGHCVADTRGSVYGYNCVPTSIAC